MTRSPIKHFGLDRQYQNLKSELLSVTDSVMSTGILVDGPYSEQVKEWLSDRTGCQYVILCHSGTQALEIMARHEIATMPDTDPYTEWKYDKEAYRTIRIPNITYPATLNAFASAGFNIDLCDVDSNGIMIPNSEPEQPKLECYVGLYGNPIPQDRFENVCIVDGAQHWLVADGHVGVGMAISFDPTKNLSASGNGGALVTNDEELAGFAMRWRNNGKPDHLYPGTNSKMSEIDCAHLLVRTKYIDDWQARRKEIRLRYLDTIDKIPSVTAMSNRGVHADQKFVIRNNVERDGLKKVLEEKEIDVRIHYDKPLSDTIIGNSEYIKERPDMMSTSHALCRGVLSLPIYPELTDEEVEHICTSLIYYFDAW